MFILLILLSCTKIFMFKDKGYNLIQAAKNGDLSLVEKLIINGEDINDDSSDETALMLASQNGHKEIVELLLEKGADVNKMDAGNCNALNLAAWNGHDEIVELLIENGADPNSKAVNAGCMLNLYFYHKKNPRITKLLIEKGADINTVLSSGMTILHHAISNHNFDIARLLIEKGADVNLRVQDNPRLTTMLIDTVMLGNKELIQLFIDKGVNVNEIVNYNNTALNWAIHQCNPNFSDYTSRLEIVSMLLENGANPNDITLDGQHSSILQWARLKHFATTTPGTKENSLISKDENLNELKKIICLLLDKEANVSKDDYFPTLDWVCKNCDKERTDRLLNNATKSGIFKQEAKDHLREKNYLKHNLKSKKRNHKRKKLIDIL